MRSAHDARRGSWVTITTVVPVITCEPGEQRHDLVAGDRVEGAGRLVGEEETTVADHRSRDRNALTLSTGEVIRVAVDVVGQVDSPQHVAAARSRLSGGDTVEFEREHDVLDRGQRRDEIQLLEHVSDMASTQLGMFAGSHRRHIDAADEDAVLRSGRSSAPARWRSVDLPHPDGPMTAQNCPVGKQGDVGERRVPR